jgi:hypothetical protein
MVSTPIKIPATDEKAKFSDVKHTDSSGKVTFQDPISRSIVSIVTKDKNSGQVITSIKLEYLSDGSSYVIIGIDSLGIYKPSILTGPFKSSSSETFPKIILAKHINRENYSNLQDGWDYIFQFMEFVSIASSISDLVSLLSDMPSLEQHTLFYDELCMTGSQMANSYGFSTGTAEFILGKYSLFPLSGEILRKQFGNIVAALILSAQAGKDNSVKEFLQSQPGAYLIRFYRLPVPFTILLIDIKGMCIQQNELKS